MVIRIASILLGILSVVALILGVLFWTGNAYGLVNVHMILGILIVVLLWGVGVGQALSKGGSWPLAIGAIVFGIVMTWLGMAQRTLLPGPSHIVIQIVHLFLGLATVGFAQSMAGRYKRALQVGDGGLTKAV